AQRFCFGRERGRLSEIDEWFRQGAERQIPLMKTLHAWCLDESGQTQAVATVLDEMAATGFAHPTNNVAWLCFMAECAWLTARLGRKDYVAPLRSRLVPYADQLVVG